MDDRDPKTGRWLPRNRGAEDTGVFTLQRRALEDWPAAWRETYEAALAGILADMGDLCELSTLEKQTIRQLATVETLATLAWADVEARGALTPRGRRRSSVDLYLKSIERFERLAKVIGLKRRQKRVADTTIENYLARKLKEKS